MRREFIGHHPISPDEIDRLWTGALVVVDTNVLLSFYKLSVGARMKLMSVLEEFQDRLWIPYQVGEEFHRNRVERIREQRGMGAKLGATLESFKKAFANKLQDFSQNAFFETSSLQAKWEEIVDEFRYQVRDLHSSKMAEYAITPQSDPVLARLAELYEGRIGAAPSDEDLEKLYVIAQGRYENKVPPGYEDAKNKTAPRCYGDYILWSQIIEHAKQSSSDVLFVTDDQKSDWWWEVGGETLGPEPQIRREFSTETGKVFYAYRSNQLVRIFDERRSIAVDEAVVEEIRVVSEQAGKTDSSGRITVGELAKMIDLGQSGVPMSADSLLGLIGGLRESEAASALQAAYAAHDRLRNLHASTHELEINVRAIESRIKTCEYDLAAARGDDDEIRVNELEEELRKLRSRHSHDTSQLHELFRSAAMARTESERASEVVDHVRAFMKASAGTNEEEDILKLMRALTAVHRNPNPWRNL